MKAIPFLFLIFFLSACQTNQVQVTSEVIDHDFTYINTVTGHEASYHDDLDLRIKVSASDHFDNRLQQIEWALEITSLAINTELSEYNFAKLPPSPYLSINKLISIKHYLRLAGFHGQNIVVDSDNNMVIYLKDNSRFLSDINTLKPDVIISPVLIDDDVNTVNELTNSELGNLTTETHDTVIESRESDTVLPTSFDSEPSSDDLLDDSSLVTENNLSNNNNADSGLPDNEKLDISVNTDQVIEKVKPTELFIKKNQSLRQIFTYIAEYNDMDFVSSLGRHDWFLNSTINHSYTFRDLDHALLLLLDESNHILANNSLGFLLKASLNNNILDLYYE